MRRPLLITAVIVGTFLAGAFTTAAFLLLDPAWHELGDTQ